MTVNAYCPDDFILGAASMGFVCIALFFLRFWRQSRDSFHLLFAGAFALLAVQRVLLAALSDERESLPESYLLRLAAYVLIVVAVARKNAPTPRDRG
jgi:membrane-associated PAP2 superfamily phosphatase